MAIPVFKPDFFIFFYDKELGRIERNFMIKFLFYHTSLTDRILLSDCPYFLKYWAIYVLQLFASQFVES